MFINSSACTRLLTARFNRKPIVVKFWKLSKATVCVMYRFAGEKLVGRVVLHKQVFLQDAIKIRTDRVNNTEFSVLLNDNHTAALVNFAGKDQHYVSFVSAKNISCSCPDFESQENFQRDYAIPAICSHLLAVAKSLGFRKFGEMVEVIKLKENFAA